MLISEQSFDPPSNLTRRGSPRLGVIRIRCVPLGLWDQMSSPPLPPSPVTHILIEKLQIVRIQLVAKVPFGHF